MKIFTLNYYRSTFIFYFHAYRCAFFSFRYDFINKGADIFIEGLARLNDHLKVCCQQTAFAAIH